MVSFDDSGSLCLFRDFFFLIVQELDHSDLFGFLNRRGGFDLLDFMCNRCSSVFCLQDLILMSFW